MMCKQDIWSSERRVGDVQAGFAQLRCQEELRLSEILYFGDVSRSVTESPPSIFTRTILAGHCCSASRLMSFAAILSVHSPSTVRCKVAPSPKVARQYSGFMSYFPSFFFPPALLPFDGLAFGLEGSPCSSSD